jgi:TonB-linked SusC/RagA family outer membrane protein
MQKGFINQRFISLIVKVSLIQLFIVLFFASSLSAFSVKGQVKLDSKISVNITNATLEDALTAIEKMTEIKFSYNSKVIKRVKNVSLNFNNEILGSALNKLLAPYNFQYLQQGNTFIIQPLAYNSNSSSTIYEAVNSNKAIIAETTIRGRVLTLESKEALPGVSISIKGTTRGTTSNSNGEFTLDIPSDKAVLVFSFVGYLKQEVVVGNRSNINISLVQDAKSLEEVVVIGYGDLKKSDLTGSVSTLKAAGNEDKPITSVDQFIQGRVSGVQITQNSGAPGSGMTFLIRGASSITGSNQPLIILDGYPIESDQRSLTPNTGTSMWESSTPPTNPLASINPNDIESIEILKDASSTAIYGSRGANGVVLITTKRGKNNRDQFSYSFRTDVSSLPKKIDVLNAQDFINFANEGALNSKRDSVYKSAVIPGLLANDYFWQNLILQKAVSQDHQLSFSGGDEKTKYSVSGNYYTQNGIVKNSSFNRGSIRLNLDRQVLPRLKVYSSFNGSVNQTKSTQQSNSNGDPSGSAIFGAVRFRPIFSPFAAGDDEEPALTVEGNPLTLVTLGENIATSNVVLANLKGDYKITDGLNFIVNTGVNNTNSKRDNFQPFGTFAGRANGYAFTGESSNFNFLIENTLAYNKTIAKKHRINAVGGYTWQQWRNRSFGIQATQFVSEALGAANFQLASSASIPVTTMQEWALQSVLGRFNYSYDNRYLITLTGRSDGASRLSEGNKWAFFPSIAGGWNVHNERFMKDQNLINELKIRASYGISGNQSIGVGSSSDRVGTVRTVLNGAIVSALAPSGLGNSNLGWEITKQTNFGVDVTILDNRLKLGFEAYSRKTSDLLINLSLPGSTGFTSYAANFGDVENKGLEFDVDALILKGDFNWNFNGNLSINRNNITSLPNGIQLFGQTYLAVGSIGLGQPANIAIQGSPIGAFYGYRVNGVYQNAAEVTNGPVDPTLPTPGDIRYEDTNGDGKISADDRSIIGNPYPKFTFGFTNDFRWKDFTLSVFFMGSQGQDVMNLNRHILDALTFTTGTNMRTEAYLGRWTGEGTSNYYPQARNVGNAFRGRLSNFYLEDGSFVRLKNISLAYNLPSKKVGWIKNAKVYVSATNLFTWTNYKGYDPEVSTTATSSLSPGIDFGTVPQYRTFSTGVNFTF